MSENIEHKAYLTPVEAAEYANISRRQIDKLRIEGNPIAGTLPYFKIGKTIRIKRTDIDNYLKKLRVC